MWLLLKRGYYSKETFLQWSIFFSMSLFEVYIAADMTVKFTSHLFTLTEGGNKGIIKACFHFEGVFLPSSLIFEISKYKMEVD